MSLARFLLAVFWAYGAAIGLALLGEVWLVCKLKPWAWFG